MEDWLDDLLRDYHDKPSVSPTSGYHYYVRLGSMTVKAGMEGEIDVMLRRSSFKDRERIDGQIDAERLWARSVSAGEAGFAKSTNGLVRARGVDGSRSIAHQSLPTEPSTKVADEDEETPDQPGYEVMTG